MNHIRFLSATIALLAATPHAAAQPTTAAASCPEPVINQWGNIVEYCGVPLDLWIAGLKNFDHDMDWGYDEGGLFLTALVRTHGIELSLQFSTDGELTGISSEDDAALFGNEGVGSTLGDLRKTWPDGRFIVWMHHGGGARYLIGKNISFEFAVSDLPEGMLEPPSPPFNADARIDEAATQNPDLNPEMRVRSISIRPIHSDPSECPAPKLDAAGSITELCGIPTNVKISELRKYLPGFTQNWATSEGRYYPRVWAKKHEIGFDLHFSNSGDLRYVDVQSRGAIFPRGVGVGSTLHEVQDAWPGGDFSAERVLHPSVTYRTPQNLIFEFGQHQMPRGYFDGTYDQTGKLLTPPKDVGPHDPDRLTVGKIRIVAQ